MILGDRRAVIKMMKYSFTCTCGDVMSVDAENREEAVAKLKEMMSEKATAEHMAEKHAGEPVPSQEQIHMMIEQGTVEGESAPTGGM